MILRGYHQCDFCHNYFSWTAVSDAAFEIEGVQAAINNTQADEFEVIAYCPGCHNKNTFVMVQ